MTIVVLTIIEWLGRAGLLFGLWAFWDRRRIKQREKCLRPTQFMGFLNIAMIHTKCKNKGKYIEYPLAGSEKDAEDQFGNCIKQAPIEYKCRW